MLATVGTRTGAHSLRRQVGIGSESDCLLGQSDRTFRSSVSEAELKKEKSGGVSGGEAGLERTLRGYRPEKEEV